MNNFHSFISLKKTYVLKYFYFLLIMNDHDHDDGDDVALLSWRPAMTMIIVIITMLSFYFATSLFKPSYTLATLAYLPFHFTFLLYFLPFLFASIFMLIFTHVYFEGSRRKWTWRNKNIWFFSRFNLQLFPLFSLTTYSLLRNM